MNAPLSRQAAQRLVESEATRDLDRAAIDLLAHFIQEINSLAYRAAVIAHHNPQLAVLPSWFNSCRNNVAMAQGELDRAINAQGVAL